MKKVFALLRGVLRGSFGQLETQNSDKFHGEGNIIHYVGLIDS